MILENVVLCTGKIMIRQYVTLESGRYRLYD